MPEPHQNDRIMSLTATLLLSALDKLYLYLLSKQRAPAKEKNLNVFMKGILRCFETELQQTFF
jgi:hypothetical protein